MWKSPTLQKWIHHTCFQAGRKAVAIDLDHDASTMNVATDLGFANCLYHACNLKAGAACVVAPVCGSWVYMQHDGN